MFTCATKYLSEACPSTCICEKHLTSGRINQVAVRNMRSICNAGPISNWNSPISQFTPPDDFPVRRCTFWLAERNNRTDIVIGREERIRSVTHQRPCCWDLLSSTNLLYKFSHLRPSMCKAQTDIHKNKRLSHPTFRIKPQNKLLKM